MSFLLKMSAFVGSSTKPVEDPRTIRCVSERNFAQEWYQWGSRALCDIILWLSAKTWCFITLCTVLEEKTKTNQILGFCHNPGRVIATLCDITESNQMTFPTYWEITDRLETHFSRRDMQRVNFASYLMAAGHLLVSDPLCWTSVCMNAATVNSHMLHKPQR